MLRGLVPRGAVVASTGIVDQNLQGPPLVEQLGAFVLQYVAHKFHVASAASEQLQGGNRQFVEAGGRGNRLLMVWRNDAGKE